ncbi:hypothetical protein P3T37_003351 [Kitasatospora sp. MAA4]|nr:hypothetical protein [Kitasatospora sp. MAA4]
MHAAPGLLVNAQPDSEGPEFLAPSWTYALGGPAPEPLSEGQDDSEPEPPPLEPVHESETLRRVRARMHVLDQYRHRGL